MTVSELAVTAAKSLVDPERQIIDCMWIPFALLYDELIKEGVPKLSELPEDKKLHYWNKTKDVRKGNIDLEKKRIMICEALYVYELITKPDDQ